MITDIPIWITLHNTIVPVNCCRVQSVRVVPDKIQGYSDHLQRDIRSSPSREDPIVVCGTQHVVRASRATNALLLYTDPVVAATRPFGHVAIHLELARSNRLSVQWTQGTEG